MTRTRSATVNANLAAVGITLVFVLLVGAITFVGRQPSGDGRDATKSTHHMASLAQIHAVLKKSRDDADQ